MLTLKTKKYVLPGAKKMGKILSGYELGKEFLK